MSQSKRLRRARDSVDFSTMSKRKYKRSDKVSKTAGEVVDDLASAFRNVPKALPKKYSKVRNSDAWAKLEGSKPSRFTGKRGVVSKIKHKLLTKKNYGEATAARLLQACGLEFEREKEVFHEGRMFFLDFVVKLRNGDRVAVEIDGSIHLLPEVSQNDLVKDKAILAKNWLRCGVRIPVRVISRMTSVELLMAINGAPKGVITRLG